jgi:hypothetical protein
MTVHNPLATVAAEFRACAESIALSARIMRASMPQTYSMRDLQKRYRGYNPRRLTALLREFGYDVGSGKRPCVAFDDVIRLDARIRVDVAPMRAEAITA